MKYTLNYDTGDCEWMDKSGYSYDTGIILIKAHLKKRKEVAAVCGMMRMTK